LAEQVRASICEDQIQQIIWRGRGVNRSADHPLDVVILGDCITAQPDEIENWYWPSLDDRIFAQTGVWMENASHVSRTFPLLTGNIERIKKARQRLGTVSYKDYYRKTSPTSSPHLRTVTYRLTGPGQRRHQAVFDAREWADQDRVKGWLEGKLGALASFEVVGFEPTPLPDAADLAENIDLQVGRAPSPADSGLRPPIGVDPPLDAWTGGHLTARQAQWARDRLKSTAQTQEDVARAAGLSRPQLTNALRGRFGLSVDAARRVHEVLDALPVVQPSLGFL
jgi:hypothetical protein